MTSPEAPAPVVRRCHRCGAAAMVSDRTWQQTMLLGHLRTGAVPREDFVCQGCGHVYPWKAMGTRWMVAFLMGLPTIGMGVLGFIGGLIAGLAEGNWAGLLLGLVLPPLGLGILLWALEPWWQARRHPVVPDAPLPVIRYRQTEPLRRCSCGAPTPCTHVLLTRFSLERTYGCGACGRSFTVTDTWGSIFTALASLLALGLGLGLLSTAPGQGAGAWACSGAVLLLGLGGLLLFAVRLLDRWRHPVLLPRPD